MDLLTINDQPGKYPNSWYHHSANSQTKRPQLNDDLEVDVCIVGGGYTGLSAALHLARNGINCVVLEANRVGWGASGRNGGQVGIGFNQSQEWLANQLGQTAAQALWDLGLQGARLVESLIVDHNISCDLQKHILYPTHSKRYFNEIVKDIEALQKNYEADKLNIVPPDEINNWLATDHYHGAVLNRYARHLHPLNYALGLADAASNAGAKLFENSRVIKTRLPYLRSHVSMTGHRVETEHGSVNAEHIIFACNGYHNELHPQIAKHVMPINNYIVATKPLPENFPDNLIANRVAVADSRFVVNYFRLSQDNRLLFGGGETWNYRFPKDIYKLVRRNLIEVFPQLADTELEFAWGGTLAITRERLPFLRKFGTSVWAAGGYSGHGVALSTLAGKLMSDAIQGDDKAFKLLSQLPCTPFPGDDRFRPALLKLGMAWYAMRDRIGL